MDSFNVAVVLGYSYITDRTIYKDLSYTIIQYFSLAVHCTKNPDTSVKW